MYNVRFFYRKWVLRTSHQSIRISLYKFTTISKSDFVYDIIDKLLTKAYSTNMFNDTSTKRSLLEKLLSKLFQTDKTNLSTFKDHPIQFPCKPSYKTNILNADNASIKNLHAVYYCYDDPIEPHEIDKPREPILARKQWHSIPRRTMVIKLIN